MTPQRPDRRRPLTLLAIMLALVAPFFVPIPVELQQHPVVSPLADRVHVALFAAITLFLHRFGPLRGRAWRVMLACIVLGGLTEVVQIAAGRSASLWDCFQDTQGVALAGCWIWWRTTRWPVGPVLAALVVLLAVAWPLRRVPAMARESFAVLDQFPVLCDFEREQSEILWSSHMGSDIQRVAREDDGHALRIDHAGDDRWPGAVSRHLAWNWTGQDTLLVDVRLAAPAPDSVKVTVWMEDRRTGHDIDYAMTSTDIGHDWTTLRIPLSDLRTRRRGRPLALKTVQALSVFMSRRGDEHLVLLVDNLRLAPGG